MRGRTDRYDWVAYYAAAYESERKKNNVLAGRIADTERRLADLNDNLDRICDSPFWRMTAPARRLYRRIRDGAVPEREGKEDASSELCLLRYREELHRQADPYTEWIKRENDRYNNDCNEKEISVEGWQSIRIPDSDIMILTCGKGIVDRRAMGEIKSCFNTSPSCKAAYTDEDFYWGDLTRRMHPWFKPCYSPDTLLSFNCWGHLVAVRAELLSDALTGEELSGGQENAAQAVRFYDLCLRLEEAVQRRCRLDGSSWNDSICHIDGVLYHQAYEPPAGIFGAPQDPADPEERFAAVRQCLKEELEAGRHLTGAGRDGAAVREAALGRRGVKGTLAAGHDPGIFHIIYDTSISGRERCARAQSEDRHIPPHHLVSVVILSKDHPEVLERLLTTFREKTDYEYYEWIVVDNGSSAANREGMARLQARYGFVYLYEEMPFNFSRMCNMGAGRATGDLLLFMNDDMEILEHSWLRRMAGQALLPYTGAVGAKLWYAGTQKIQHAGITNMEIGPSHKLITYQDNRDYYYGRSRVTYNVSAVTAACLMISRRKYEEAGGFDETMPVAYNDVDFCFRLSEAGYYNVQRNDAVLYHHESLSRGLDEQDGGKWRRLLAEKEALYAKHPQMKGRDAFYHRALIDNASDYGCNYKFDYEEREKTVSVETQDVRLLKRAKPNRLRLTVDRAEIQHKIHAEEADILWIMGWSYIPGADNALCARRILLQRLEDGGACYTAVPFNWRREDVEKVLPTEQNIGLAGFVLRVLRADLPAGTYRVGMLCTDGQGGRLIAWSEAVCAV